MDYLKLEGRKVLVTGVANKKSVAYHIGRALSEAGAEPVYVVRSETRKDECARLLAGAPIYVCDVEQQEQIEDQNAHIQEMEVRLRALESGDQGGLLSNFSNLWLGGLLLGAVVLVVRIRPGGKR